MTNAADLLAECLEAEGVDYVFGIPGEELEDVLFALRDSDVDFFPVRHEQAAAFMADVHGRVTGDAGVCLSTLGPGATNLLTGVADAHLDKSPLVAITGQGGLERLHKESHQALDVVDTFEPIVKWNTQVSAPETVPESVRKAFKLAEHEKPGATHLEVPEDVAAESIDATPLPTRERVRRPDPDEASLSRAADLIAGSDQPIVLAGNGAVRTRAAEQLRAFVETTNVPVVATFMGKGAVSDADEHSLLTLESGPDGESVTAIDRADCVVAVGYDVAEHDPEEWNPGPEKTVIHVDADPAEVYRHYNPDVEVVADVSRALEELTGRLSTECSTWWTDLRERIADDVGVRPDAGDPVTVRRVLPLLRDAMADEDVLISDVGSHKMAIAKRFPAYEPNTCIISNGLASMGIAVPGGVAADLALDEDVVVATGDGGFLMNAAEIETASRLGCSYTVVVFRDDDYGMISKHQEQHRSEHFGTALSNPDLVAFAESFGIEAHRADDWEAIEATLNDVASAGEMTLVEVPLD